MREPFGALRQRTVRDIDAGHEGGRRAFIHYDSVFEREARELVVVSRDAEGPWQVLEYELRISDESAQKSAEAVADEWMGRVGQGDASTTWDDADDTFKRHVTKADWQALLQLRTEWGAPQMRTAIDDGPMQTLLRCDGETVVRNYEERFEQRNVRESIEVTQDGDGRWRVSRYSFN